jgi:hypothetical protein
MAEKLALLKIFQSQRRLAWSRDFGFWKTAHRALRYSP